MARIKITDLDDAVVAKLRVRAARNHRSLEAEIRETLARAVVKDPDPGLAQVILDRFAEIGGVDLELPERTSSNEPATRLRRAAGRP